MNGEGVDLSLTVKIQIQIQIQRIFHVPLVFNWRMMMDYGNMHKNKLCILLNLSLPGASLVITFSCKLLDLSTDQSLSEWQSHSGIFSQSELKPLIKCLPSQVKTLKSSVTHIGQNSAVALKLWSLFHLWPYHTTEQMFSIFCQEQNTCCTSQITQCSLTDWVCFLTVKTFKIFFFKPTDQLHVLMNHGEELPLRFNTYWHKEMLFGVIQGTDTQGKMLLYNGDREYLLKWSYNNTIKPACLHTIIWIVLIEKDKEQSLWLNFLLV